MISSTPVLPISRLTRKLTRSDGSSVSAMNGMKMWAPIRIMKTVAVVCSVCRMTNWRFSRLRDPAVERHAEREEGADAGRLDRREDAHVDGRRWSPAR